MLFEYASSFLGWSLLPHLGTKFLLGAYYGYAYGSSNRPRAGTPLYFKHYRRAHIAIIIGYLLFTISTTYIQIQRNGDFYQALGIDLDATDRQIKSKFRRLAAQYHPDKQMFSSETSENAFMVLKSAQDLLINPVNRFVYDRFGPQVLSWPHSATIKEYLAIGFRVQWPFYVGSVIGMFIMRATGFLRGAMIWRLLAFANLGLLEVYIVTRPELPFISNYINPALSHLGRPLLPFQIIELARKLTVSTLIAMSQLEPYLRDGTTGSDNELEHRLVKLEVLGMQVGRCTDDMVTQQMLPFINDKEALRSLEHATAERLARNVVLSDLWVRDAIAESKNPTKETVVSAEAVSPENLHSIARN